MTFDIKGFKKHLAKIAQEHTARKVLRFCKQAEKAAKRGNEKINVISTVLSYNQALALQNGIHGFEDFPEDIAYTGELAKWIQPMCILAQEMGLSIMFTYDSNISNKDRYQDITFCISLIDKRWKK